MASLLLCCVLMKAFRGRALKAFPRRPKLSLEWPTISRKQFFEYYTVESRVEKCEEHSAAAVGTVRIFAMGWKGGKIVKFAWGGPKGGKVEY
jgi:hypothetical protein